MLLLFRGLKVQLKSIFTLIVFLCPIAFFAQPAITSFTPTSGQTDSVVVAPGFTGDVIVTTNLGSASKAEFTFINVPAITSFSPMLAQPGDTVTITGTTLALTTAVTFGGVAAASFTVVDSTTLKAVVAYGATGSVVVTTVGGSASKDGFVLNLPVITSVNPAGAAVGTTVTITGKNFNPNATDNIVYFGAVQARVNSASLTSLNVTVPIGATYAPVSVTVYNRTAYSTQPFMPTFDGAGSTLQDTSFNGKTRYTINYGPAAVHMSDLDGDKKPDIIVANDFGSPYSGINIMRNTSTPGKVSFPPETFYSTGGFPEAVNTGDFDGDGKPDLAIGNSGADQVLIYKNASTAGNIILQPYISFNTYERPKSIAIEDFNGDGKPDMAIANHNSDAISIFLNTTKGNTISFAWQYTVYTGALPSEVRVGDIDGDGKADLVVSNQGMRVNSFSVFRNISTGGNVSFDARLDFFTDSQAYPATMALGDLDADGKPDVVVGNYNAQASTLSVFKNTSSPGMVSFSARTDYTTGSAPAQVNIGDMDGDGKPDIVMAGRGMLGSGMPLSSISFYKNNSAQGTLTLAQRIIYSSGRGTSDVFIGDADGDGKPDLVATNYEDNTVVVMRNGLNENGTSVLTPAISSFTPASGTSGTVVTIKGNYFTGTTAVSFGGTPAASFTIVSDSVITAIVGTGSSGVIEIVSVNGKDTLGVFEYLSATPQAMSVAPNPANGYIIVNHPVSNNTAVIKVTNAMGVVAGSVKVSPTVSQTRVDLTGFAPGIYIIWWGDGANASSKTIMIQ